MIQFPFAVCNSSPKQMLSFTHPFTNVELKNIGVLAKLNPDYETPSDTSFRKQVMSWFFSLSASEKQNAASIASSVLARVLIQILKHYNWIRQGYGCFLYYPEYFGDDEIEFKHLMETCNSKPDKYIMKHLRFYTTYSKYDSIAMSLEFFANDVNLLNVLYDHSQSEYFATPCGFKWDQEKHIPLWRVPDWFLNKKMHTIGDIVICVLERTISMKYIYYHSKGLPIPEAQFKKDINTLQPFLDKLNPNDKENIYFDFTRNLEKANESKKYETNDDCNYKLAMKLRGQLIQGISFISNITLIPAKHIKQSTRIYETLLEAIVGLHGKSVANTLLQEESTIQNVKKPKPHKKAKPSKPIVEGPQSPPPIQQAPATVIKFSNTKSTTDSSHSDNDHNKEKNRKRYKRRPKHTQIDEVTLSSKSKQEATNLFREIIGDSKKHTSVPAFSFNQPTVEKHIISYWRLDEEIRCEIERIDDYMRSLWPYRKLFLSNLSYLLINSKSSMLMNLRYDLYGSIKTGLAVESSDMDIALSDPTICNSTQIKEIFAQLQKILQKEEYIHSSKYIESARVPVLKLVLILQRK